MYFNAFSQDYYYIPDSKKSKSDTTKNESKTVLRIKGGLNLSNQFERDDEEIYHGSLIKPGFHLGITTEFQFSEIFSFETGLLISTKGYRYDYQSFYGDIRDLTYFKSIGSVNLVYLDIPLMVKFYFNPKAPQKLYGILGSYISVGIGGTDKGKDTDLDDGSIEKFSNNITFGYNDEAWYNLFDFGLIAGIGADFNRYQIGLAYNFGLISIDDYFDDGYVIKNRVLQLSVAYKF